MIKNILLTSITAAYKIFGSVSIAAHRVNPPSDVVEYPRILDETSFSIRN